MRILVIFCCVYVAIGRACRAASSGAKFAFSLGITLAYLLVHAYRSGEGEIAAYFATYLALMESV